ncbi:hypothetical protein, partial [Xanthomonas vasicola]|uniref:hypothetical protein n=1 Tax=Xanthomonas vasicola TaxID=56459 RepID=UPI001C71C869
MIINAIADCPYDGVVFGADDAALRFTEKRSINGILPHYSFGFRKRRVTFSFVARVARDGLINATGKRSNRIRRAEGAQIADFLPVSARLRGVAWITG